MKSHRMNFLESSIESIKNNKYISINIKIVIRIFENYPIMATNLEDTSKNMILNEL